MILHRMGALGTRWKDVEAAETVILRLRDRSYRCVILSQAPLLAAGDAKAGGL